MSKERRLAICHGGSWANSKCLFHSKSESTNQPSARKGGAGGSTLEGFNRGEKAVNMQSNFARSAFSSSLLCPALEMRRGLSGQQFSYRGSFS